jgi:hypothetical protein
MTPMVPRIQEVTCNNLNARKEKKKKDREDKMTNKDDCNSSNRKDLNPKM